MELRQSAAGPGRIPRVRGHLQIISQLRSFRIGFAFGRINLGQKKVQLRDMMPRIECYRSERVPLRRGQIIEVEGGIGRIVQRIRIVRRIERQCAF